MRDSEALLLGATMLRPIRGRFFNSERTEGCALGMIQAARGGRTIGAVPVWMFTAMAELPCSCANLPEDALIMGGGGFAQRKDSFNEVISILVHLFNQHVCDGDWTIERLADWLRTVEPAEQPESEPTEQPISEYAEVL